MKTSTSLIAALSLTSLSLQAGDDVLPKFLQQFDTNADRTIDEEERQAITDLRAKMREDRTNSIDTDNNGDITDEEIATARTALLKQIEARRAEKFREIAGDDEVISEAEYSAIPGMDRLPDYVFEAIFDRLDADKSGDISSEEFSQRLRKHRNGRPETARASIRKEAIKPDAER